ncbi:MAG: ECF-type sigma factor [Gracilimonas sp.]|jgi:RNA polymerase sigma factor (TIGR02999 family)|nr:ECF-type sigma factor [Gracilimonas sp.]
MNDVTQILQQSDTNKTDTYEQLLPIVYDKLREIAHMRINREDPDHTFSKTDLVHEAYIRLIDIDQVSYNDRSHFYAMASKCMRRILIDHARKKNAKKRGGKEQPVTYADHLFAAERQASWLIDLEDALQELEQKNERLVHVIECRYFGEMTIEETANALDISAATVKRDWQKAKGWLYQRLKEDL